MKTLYLRNVPDDVVERLERLAERDMTFLTSASTLLSWSMTSMPSAPVDDRG
jgi:hypothetical protein